MERGNAHVTRTKDPRATIATAAAAATATALPSAYLRVKVEIGQVDKGARRHRRKRALRLGVGRIKDRPHVRLKVVGRRVDALPGRVRFGNPKPHRLAIQDALRVADRGLAE